MSEILGERGSLGNVPPNLTIWLIPGSFFQQDPKKLGGKELCLYFDLFYSNSDKVYDLLVQGQKGTELIFIFT